MTDAPAELPPVELPPVELPPVELPPVDMEKRIGQFVKLRDKRDEIKNRHEEELKPISEALEMLKGELSRGLDAQNIASAKTPCGTASFSTKASAALADKSAFWTYVVATGNFDLLDYKANVTAVTAHIEKNGGVAPPGVNYTTFRDVNVRRPTGTGK